MTRISILRAIFTRSDCSKLISYDTRVVKISGVTAENGTGITLELGALSYHKETIREASEIADALDDYQYHLCKEMEGLDRNSDRYIERFDRRSAMIGLITLFRVIVGGIKNTEEFLAELKGLIIQMREILLAGLGPKTITNVLTVKKSKVKGVDSRPRGLKFKKKSAAKKKQSKTTPRPPTPGASGPPSARVKWRKGGGVVSVSDRRIAAVAGALDYAGINYDDVDSLRRELAD